MTEPDGGYRGRQEKNLTTEQLDILLHTTGLDRSETSYRNHFVTDEGCDDYNMLLDLVTSGHMVMRLDPFGTKSKVFSATQLGHDACIDHKQQQKIAYTKNTTRSQRRYKLYLKSDTEFTFLEYLKYLGSPSMADFRKQHGV